MTSRMPGTRNGGVMMRGSLLIVGVLACFLCAGCNRLPSAHKTGESPQKPLDVLVLLDDSGSFVHRSEAVDSLLVPAIEQLQGGDRLVCRAIGANSMRAEDLVNIRLPSSDRPFDVQSVRAARQVRADAEARLRAFAQRQQKAPRTDIVGAIASITQVSRRPGAQRLLLIASDLHDTGGGLDRMRGVDLGGTRVVVVFCEQDESLAEYQHRVEVWRKAFEQAGAVSVRIYNPTASRALEPAELLGRE